MAGRPCANACACTHCRDFVRGFDEFQGFDFFDSIFGMHLFVVFDSFECFGRFEQADSCNSFGVWQGFER